MDAIDQLKTALRKAESKLEDLRKVEQEVEGLRIAIAVMQGEPIPQQESLKRTDYVDLGVTAATKKFLREMKEPQDTRTIADALIARGLTTTSKNFIATVYATLRNGQMFKRTKDSKWSLVEDAREGR